MRVFNILLASWIATGAVSGTAIVDVNEVEKRQGSSASALPTLGSESTASVSVPSSSSPTATNTPTSGTVSATNSASASGSASGSSSRPQSSSSVSPSSSLVPSSTSSTSTPTTSTAASATTSAADANQNVLPLQPHITPALSIAGVILILTGIVYTLIGVKNRWVHIFLSTAYLSSLSIAVLIVYVCNPPVSNAIQGAYFVGIFMTGIIFGSGALIFKEVTEGLGCLLGGFCLSMWFLTLKEGGLITNTSGKAIFISIFCIVSWSLSFSHYTRPYGLMGSISFSGATVFVLGIDCFSRGGLKEFWVYIWALNDNLFPLNTNTFPITRGTRVETIVIILVCIIGVISQLKLWKIVKDRQTRREAAHQDESRRRDVVEAALGRHLERQNDRDRSQWEKQYGDRLGVKRDTILWTDAHAEKGYTKIKETELKGSQNSSVENLEMLTLGPKTPRSMYVTKIKRQSSALVNSIPELEETETGESDHVEGKEQVRQKVLDKLEGNTSTSRLAAGGSSAKKPSLSPKLDDQTRRISAGTSSNSVSRDRSPVSNHRDGVAVPSKDDTDENQSSDLQRYLSAPEESKGKKRRSFSSFFSRSAKDIEASPSVSASQEALVVPDLALSHSRASSLAATLDFENEVMELPMINTTLANSKHTPEIVITPVKDTYDGGKSRSRLDVREVPPSPPALSENFDLDPEELVRPPAKEASATMDGRRVSSGFDTTSKRQSSSETGTDTMFDDGLTKSRAATSDTSHSEVLTKGFLEQVPSQLSQVVLSYRTNEWAKHISTAEAPIFEEPESLEGEGSEEPTHLADPAAENPSSKRSSLNQAPPPPELTAPIPLAIPSPTAGMRVNPVIQPEPSPISSPTTKITPVISTRSTSEGKQVPRGFRSTSTPLLNKPLQTSPIDQNTVLNYVPPQMNQRSASSASINRMPPNNRSSSNLVDYQALQRSGSRLSLVSEHGVPSMGMSMPTRSTSQLSNHQPLLVHPQRTETRMTSYDSHQPLRRNTSVEAHHREARLADWRGSQQKNPMVQMQTDRHRQQMLMDHQQVKMMEEQEKALRLQHELAVDARMRGRDMQELHREAMRRLQANANKKL